jgi:small subunit ribosomal protein S14
MSTNKDKGKKRKSMGKGSRRCIRCGTHRAVIRSYGLNICRRCFRETARKMGFKKFQ